MNFACVREKNEKFLMNLNKYLPASSVVRNVIKLCETM